VRARARTPGVYSGGLAGRSRAGTVEEDITAMPRTALAAVISLLLAAPLALAEDPAPTPAREAVTTQPPDSKPKKLESFKEFGEELGKAGRAIGNATVDTAKSGAAKIKRDVKEKKLKPKPTPEAAPSRQDRSGTP